MSQTTPAATPEELARTAWAEILQRITECPVGWPESGQPLADIIAAAIRQHSEAQRAEIERLTEALDDVQTAYCNHVMQQTDANVIAQSVADYGSAEAAVKGLHDFQLRVHQTMIGHFKSRATTAEAALAAVTAERDALAAEADSLRYDAGMTRTLRDKAGAVCGAAQRLVYEMRNHVPSEASLPHASLELQAIRRAYDALSAALSAKEATDER